MIFLWRHYVPLWWPEWGGGFHQLECHEPVPSAQALGSHLLIRPCPASLCPQSLGRQEREWKSLPGGVHQESFGMCDYEQTKMNTGDAVESENCRCCKHQTSVLHCAFGNAVLLCFFQANNQACQGKYVSSGVSSAGGESLFVANHAY